MGRKTTGLLALTFFMVIYPVKGQEENYNFNFQALGGYTTPGVVPFWLRANRYGSIPVDGASMSLIGSVQKGYDVFEDRLFDWGFSFEGRVNTGQYSSFNLIEGYGKARIGVLEVRAGRSREIMGLCDTTLSSGSYAVSGNGLGIPKLGISIVDFFQIPWFDKLLAIKGNFSHGWIGKTSMKQGGNEGEILMLNTFLHQKSFYGRIGKPTQKYKFYAGFNHQVMWGEGKEFYGDVYNLSLLETYLYVISTKPFNNGEISEERPGNHLGSVDLAFEYEFPGTKILLYRQSFYESGALANLANIQDGLNGIAIQNLRPNDKVTYWSRFLFELLYTKNQAGEPWSPPTTSSYDGYYNHGQYINGWSYKGAGLGTPFITSRVDARIGLASNPLQYFINNRLLSVHFGSAGAIKSVEYLFRASWSRNYGTYWTTDEEQSTNIPDPGEYGIFGVHDQFSGYCEINKKLNNGINLGLIGSFDQGELLYNSFGVFVKAAYSFDL